MAKCKLCKKAISDGMEFCTECADKKDIMANESYLDNLLNSVQEKPTTASDIYKNKKKKGEQKSKAPETLVQPESHEDYPVDLEDLEDFSEFDYMNELDDPIIISHEALYGEEESEPDAQVESDLTADEEHNIDSEFLQMDDTEVHNEAQDDEYIEPILDDLLKHLDLSESDADEEENVDIPNQVNIPNQIDDLSESETEQMADTAKTEVSPESELLDLLNQFDPNNPIEDDIQAITNLLGGIGVEKEYPEDVGEVFSEALEAVTDLNDPDQGIKYISDESDFMEEVKDTKQKEKKPGLFTRLFANVEVDEETEFKEKKVKRKKKSKRKDEQASESDEEAEIPVRGRQMAEPLEDTQKEEAKKKKKPKKEKKKKIEILDDEVDEGRINRVGASIVFLFFGVLVVLLLVSTNIFSYTLSIRNANDYFDRQRYTQAYNEVYGIELKDEDIELYDKIMTVMFVNKQLNSYNNYYHMKKFPEALDSLLKGLQRYDKYIELATILGISTDLDYVRDQIIAELYTVFSLTEEEAMNIINSETQAQYSIAVYDVVLENILFY